MLHTSLDVLQLINLDRSATCWDPLQYSQVAPKIQALAACLLLEDLKRFSLPENAFVVDFGSGDGMLTQTELSRIRPDINMVLGIDFSAEMVQYANMKHQMNGIKFIEGDISDPLLKTIVREDLQGSLADLIYSANTLHHLHSWEKHKTMLHNAKCLLKPGGFLAFTFAGTGNFTKLLEAVEKVIRREQWNSYFSNFEYKTFLGDPETYGPFLKEAGFEIKNMGLRELPIKQNRDFWIQWFECVKGVMGYLGDAPQAVKRLFAEQVIDAYGNDTVTFVQLEVIAQLEQKAANPQDAKKYYANADVQKARAERNLKDFTFYPTDVVLDLGCGPGIITSIISEKVHSIIGLDCDIDMITTAKEHYQNPKISFEHADIRNLSQIDFADVIVCFAVLSWIPIKDHQQIFYECAKALKRGGRLLMRMAGEGDRPLQDVVEQVMQLGKWKPFFGGYISPAAYESIANVKELLLNAGFIVTDCQIVTDNIKIKSKEWMREWLATWLPELNYLHTPALKEEFSHDVVESYPFTEIPLPGLVLEALKP